MDPVFISFNDRINRIFYYFMFITFRKKVMKPNPLRGTGSSQRGRICHYNKPMYQQTLFIEEP
jgi:hypothetical protein